MGAFDMISQHNQIMDMLNDYEKAKNNVIVTLLPYNEESLKAVHNKIYRTNMDFIEVYGIKADEIGGKIALADIPTNYFDKWGITEDELRQQAIQNLNNDFMIECVDGNGLYSLTNKSAYKGSGQILNNLALERIADKMGTDKLLIIPSTVDCLYVIPYSEEIIDMLLDKQQYINDERLLPKDILSYNIYTYDVKDKVLDAIDKDLIAEVTKEQDNIERD